ncbi:thioredoxin family protein [Noviherbaspirillum suwonense]|jgi:thioredoxin 1|uniref:Thioredoxin n=1 Tax=Noviherbaspirillum suwonense TaxID=1224511 RepID=A0ABY1PVK8_9BURK|nr:thioredoxin family protein [Noviherbaspirillum suwonense]SMP50024.1 Thioredoxin [Noviherbaspirillum suwonense]
MSSLTLQHDNRAELLGALSGDVWIVACLCAAWCDVCRQFRPAFDALAARHPDHRFVWVDIEDEAEIVGDFDVEDFPTMLIQRGDTVVFFGTLLPDAGQLQRLLQAQLSMSASELQAQAASTDQRRSWQRDYNLRARLADAVGA